jgi:uncharacterized protein (UPF0276 family)
MAALPAATGLGLKPQHVDELLATRPALGFLEVHAENYMVAGGPFHHHLQRLRELYPLSLHGVGLSLGAPTPPDEAHLDRLAALMDRYQPAAFSEHLAWSGHGGVFYNDLLPLAWTPATLDRICRHVDRVQQRLKTRLLLENPATYLEHAESTLDEADFITRVVQRTGCGLLLDLNNLHVSCVNHGRNPQAVLDALPLHAVGEIHLAGFATDRDAAGAPLLIDHHGAPVDHAVWRLYAQVIARIGPQPTLLERDNHVPPLAALLAELDQAAAVMAHLPAQPGLAAPAQASARVSFSQNEVPA